MTGNLTKQAGTLIFLMTACTFLAGDESTVNLPDKENFHLFLLAGQSNMAGRGIIEDQDLVAHPRVLMLSKDRKWVPAIAPIHFDKPVAGVGLGKSFAIALAEANPDITIGLIPAACGGSPISTWEPGGFHSQTRSAPYDDAISRTRTALKDGVLTGILWHQGESDSHSGSAEIYEQKLKILIARFRSDLDQPEIPFIIGQLGQFPEKPWSPERIVVDNAQKTVAKEISHVGFVGSEGLTSNPDIVHFDARSQRIFGQRYAKTYLEITASK